MQVPFNIPCLTGLEEKYLLELVRSGRFSGDNHFTAECRARLKELYPDSMPLLTTSGTSALEMACILTELGPGDEVILPSYTFSSTATCVTMRGAVPVFVDIRPDTMNINEQLIEDAVTDKTRAIIPVHYAGMPCEMDTILDIAAKHGLTVIEDAAQAALSLYRGTPAGAIGSFGALSFHETKNLQCGEGGALLVNREKYFGRAEIIREKGTDRSKYWRGEIDKYSWVDNGSSFLPSELCSAFLLPQLQSAEEITSQRKNSWRLYIDASQELVEAGHIEIQIIPEGCETNGHIFYIKTSNIQVREKLMSFLETRGIASVFHYVPLHSSKAGKRFGRFHGDDTYTTAESMRLLRLPMFHGITSDQIQYTVESIEDFYRA